MSRSRRARAVALAAVVGLGAAACGGTDVPDDLSGPTTTETPTTTAPPPAPDGCSQDPDNAEAPDSVLRSVPAPDEPVVQPGTYTEQIVRRGALRVGVDTSTLLWSYVDPSSGEFVGFDADIAREVAGALFGTDDPDDDDRIRFVAIPYSQRVEILTEQDAEGVPPVDMVIDTFTINCQRDQEIDFSTQYFDSQQKLLVPANADIESIEELNGANRDVVCVPWGSTSIANVTAIAEAADDPFEVRGVDKHAECLVLLQQGEVTAISGDDTVLAGMTAQDPNLEVVGDGFSSEPYGIGLPPGQEEWVAYVNAVLEQLRDNGRWAELYTEHLREHLGPENSNEPPPAPPAPLYDQA